MKKVTKLVILPPAPPAPTHKWKNGITLETAALLEPMSTASTDKTRFGLNGIGLNGIAFDKDSIVGTDGRRILITNHDVTALMHEKNPTILPNDKVTHRFLKDAQMVRIQVSEDGQWFRLTAAHGREHVVEAVRANYPNWRQVLPNAKERWHLDFDGEQFAQVLRDLPMDKKEPYVTIAYRDGYSKATVGKISKLFHCVGNAVGTTKLNAIYLAQAIKQGFNRAFLGDENEPVLLVKANATYVQMPIRTGT